MDTVNEYKVELDIYNGPVDLLLYLIRKEEVNIYDIPIATITDQYLHYVETMKTLNMNIAGEFLIMAATLMYIKSCMLLPKTEIREDEEEGEDPRTSLVKQLLEYKKYKESTFFLSARADIWEKKWKRPPHVFSFEPAEQEEKIPLDGVSLWDLLQRFSELMNQTLLNVSNKVLYDDTPVQTYMEEVLQKIRQHVSMNFAALFAGLVERNRIIGFFLALLELVRLQQVKIEQPPDYSDIQISLYT